MHDSTASRGLDGTTCAEIGLFCVIYNEQSSKRNDVFGARLNKLIKTDDH